MSKIYIIDGNSLLFRAFYATFRPDKDVMRNKEGIPTNAIFLYQKMLTQIKDELSYEDKIVVCFDTGRKSFRTKELESYKLNRKPIEPTLKSQLPLAREMLDYMGILHIEQEGYEGDDLAGSLTYYSLKQGDDVTLYTSDKDFLQLLVDDKVKIRFLRKGLSEVQEFTKNNIFSIMGYQANQVVDYKGLVGDPSDNIPGIKGVGEKTACKLLSKYPHLEDIFEGLTNDNSKTSKLILENKDTALFCRKIATILTDLDVSSYYNLSKVKDGDNDKLLDFYKKYDLNVAYKQLKTKINSEMSLFNMDDFVKEDDNYKKEVIKVSSVKDLMNYSSIIVYNSSTNFHEGEVLGFYLSNGNKVCFISAEDAKKDTYFLEYLDSNLNKMTYDLKGLNICLNKLELPFIKNCEFDLLIATYLIHQNVKQDKYSCLSFYSQDLSDLSIEELDAYLAFIIPSLKDKVISHLKENEEYDLYKDVEMPLEDVLTEMEIEGFPLDKDTLQVININFQNKLDNIIEQINSLIGYKINLNSPKQVGALIYDELKLKKKSRNNSTSIDVLLKLYDTHPVIPLIIEYRKYQKLVSSYTSSLGRYIQNDGKIHAIFNQALTQTGRLSMSEPNLQNISIKDEESKEIRKAFFYKDYKYKFLSLDYSQIELRVLASLANLKDMIEVFNQGIDIHKATASKIFNVSLDEVTSSMRRKAKAVNFGIVYGISNWGLAEQINVTANEAKDIIESFYNSYPGLKQFETNIIEYAKDKGYVKTILNRRRYIQELNSDSYVNKEFGQRAAVNTVIQGSAADLIKIAMIKIQKVLKEKYETRMILQIHDELIFKVPDNEVGIIENVIKPLMENAINFECKLIVEGSFGKTWYDCK